MKVFHSPGSRSARVVWALEEIGAPYDVEILSFEQRRGPEHRPGRHPLGRVPVVELDGQQMVYESAALCLHLGDLHPEAGIVPGPASPERPLLYQWMFYAMTELEPSVIRWLRANRAGEDETEHADQFAEYVAPVRGALAGSDWLLSAFSVADIVVVKILAIAFNRELPGDPEAFADLRGYVARALARPAALRADAVGAQPA
jgi:glutathione S-transferase